MNARLHAGAAPPQRGVGTLERRIAGAVTGAASAVLFLACVVFVVQMRDMDARSLRAEAAEMAALLARQTPALLAETGAVQAQFSALSAAPSVQEATLFDGRGAVLATFKSRIGPSALAPSSVTARSAVISGGRPVGEVVVRTASHRFDPLFLSSLAIGAALFLAAAAAAMFIGRWLAGRVLDPVHRLSDAMAQVSESGDFTRLAPSAGDDELGRLTASFNDLLQRLQSNDRELRRTVTDLVEARDAAQAANVQKSQFLANMSHEIRTPLNGVLAMAQVMARGELDPQQRRRLDVVRQSGEALLSVLNDVLDVSKIEAGKMLLEPMDADVGRVVRDTVEAFADLADEKGLRLALDISHDAEGVRRVDPLRLRQVLANLVSNAVKFTERGEVKVTLRGEGRDGAEGLRLSVSDTGIGVESNRLPHLFDTFIQGDSSTTRRFGGTGLGLSITRDLIDMMGGAVWAESEPGRGSVFHAVIPLPRVVETVEDMLFAPPAAPFQAPVTVGPQMGLRILAAEDSPANRLVLSTIMEVFGVSLETVEDGYQAVEAWRRGGFDLILMDIQMPEMDGIQAARAIREIEAKQGLRRTPIIALSANAMAHQVRDYLAAGMDAHVAKPIELNRLQAAIEASLQEPLTETLAQTV